jgi:hypothetical protein
MKAIQGAIKIKYKMKPAGFWYTIKFLKIQNLSFVFLNTHKNSVALVRKRTIPTERPSHIGEVGVNTCLKKITFQSI